MQGLDLSLPETLLPGQEPAWRPEIGMSWLRKDLHHSGGQGVKDWDGSPLARGEVLQARVNGQLGSATFLADGKRAILIGLTFQYSGVPELGAENYAWCGNVVPWEDPRLAHSLARAAAALTATFGLVGINGLDFIQAEERLYLIEVNPRWPGSADLLEQASGLNLFQLHLEACAGSLPPPTPPASSPLTFGKGILYAHGDAAMPDTHSWRADGLRDIPRPGEFIPRGAPVCSILASAADAPSCWQEILRRAGELRREIWPAP
ncbi:MAG: ATP-grasp domain-containing protein [Chloroflexi bacterium]|nr:ATP-grasp domain-containing protein [Chloroflexota bacterium]